MWVGSVHISFVTATSLSPFNNVITLRKREKKLRKNVNVILLDSVERPRKEMHASHFEVAGNTKIEWRKVMALPLKTTRLMADP